MLENLPGAVGHILREQRAGMESLVIHQSGLRSGLMALDVQSLSFKDHAPLPPPYTADGAGISPPLHWSGVPPEAQQLVLIVEDADAPTPKPLVHAIVVNLLPQDAHLPEAALHSADHASLLPEPVREGRNSYLQTGWLPPDPPPGHGLHRYAFQLFALNAAVDWPATPGREALVEAIRVHAIAAGMLIGTYERPDGSLPTRDARPATVVMAPVEPDPDEAPPGLAPV